MSSNLSIKCFEETGTCSNLWSSASKCFIYGLPLPFAIASYQLIKSQLTNALNIFKIFLPTGVEAIVFIAICLLLKALHKKIRQDTEQNYKKSKFHDIVLLCGFVICGVEYQLLTNQPYHVVITVATFFLFIAISIIISYWSTHVKKQKNEKTLRINRRSRDFCFFVIFALISGSCSAFGAYAFWNMLLGQILGIIMGVIFFFANVCLLGNELFSLICKNEDKNNDKKNCHLFDSAVKMFDFIGSLGILLGFNYEVFSLFGITPQNPSFQNLSKDARIGLILASFFSILISLMYCYLVGCKIFGFKFKLNFFSKSNKDSIENNNRKQTNNYKKSANYYASILFAFITFVAVMFNNFAFSSGAFGEISINHLRTAIGIYTFLASLFGCVLLSRGYYNGAKKSYYENIKMLPKKTISQSNELNMYYNQRNKYYNVDELKQYDDIDNKSFITKFFAWFHIINPTRNAKLLYSAEIVGLGLQFAGLIYLTWSPKNGFFKEQSLTIKIGATIFLFLLFVVLSGLKSYSIYLKYKDEAIGLINNQNNDENLQQCF